jgi:hypothetical protein
MHEHLPIEALDGIACCDTATATAVEEQVKKSSKAVKVVVKPGWYF